MERFIGSNKCRLPDLSFVGLEYYVQRDRGTIVAQSSFSGAPKILQIESIGETCLWKCCQWLKRPHHKVPRSFEVTPHFCYGVDQKSITPYETARGMSVVVLDCRRTLTHTPAVHRGKTDSKQDYFLRCMVDRGRKSSIRLAMCSGIVVS